MVTETDNKSVNTLKLKYAKGEMTRKEYERARKELLSGKNVRQSKTPAVQKEIELRETELKKEEKVYFGKFKPRFFIIVAIAVVVVLYIAYSAVTPSYISSGQLSNSNLTANSKSTLSIPFQIVSNLGTDTGCSNTQVSSDIGTASVATSSSGCTVSFTPPALATTQYAHITLTSGQLTKEFTVKINADQTARISLSPNEINSPADGSSSTTITVTALDSSGSSVPDDTVITFSLTGSAGGSLSSSTCNIVSGTCQITYKASTNSGSSEIEASSYTTNASVQVTLTQLSPSSISLSSTNSSIHADGHSTTSITAKVTNRLGSIVSNANLDFSTSMGTVGQSCTTDSSGECDVTYTAPNQAGTANVTVRVSSNFSVSSNLQIALVSVSNINVQFYMQPYVGNPIVPAYAINTGYTNLNMTTISLTNTGSGSFSGTVTLTVPGWSTPVSKQVTIASQSSTTLYLNPPLSSSAFANNQTEAASYQLNITNSQGVTVYKNSYPTNITAYNNWVGFGSVLNASYNRLNNVMAAWVTIGAPAVQKLVSNAANFTPTRQILGGYGGTYAYSYNVSYHCGFLNLSTCSRTVYTNYTKQQSVNLQLQAIYNQLQAQGMHYVDAYQSFSGSQTFYTPTQSLSKGGANCIDGTFVFASATASIAFHTYLALVPGHAFVCASLNSNDTNIQCIETTWIGSNETFTAAENEGDAEYNSWVGKGQLALINVTQVLYAGVKPLPS